MRSVVFLIGLAVSGVCFGAENTYDVVVYGGTSGGVAAAVQAAKMGKTVVLIEPGRHLGGLSSGGLGATDIGNKTAIGGISREFYQRIYKHYMQPSAWKQESLAEYTKNKRGRSIDKDTMWGFEPHVAEKVFGDMVNGAKVPVVFGERLDLKTGVKKQGCRITAITMESGRTFHGRAFIDATYEGDLLAKAGVSYAVGREGNAKYGETLNGVQVGKAIYHQFIKPVDPYVRPGDPSSGLLPGIQGDGPGREGQGDRRVQAYCFRMCATDAPRNRVPWPKPEGYDPQRYELLLRNVEAGDHRIVWIPTRMPNRKTDSNNRYAVSTDNIGMNYDYPDGDYATRERTLREHETYQKGPMWTLANHPRVAEEVRSYFRNWGLPKDEFIDNGHWPHQLYVREARRMVGDYVMTQHDCQGDRVAPDPIGLGAYGMDSHHTQRYVDDQGHVRNEGDVEVGGFSPYPVSYRSIVPKASECTNLVVPVCVSASHIAYGSIRMEPVFMVLGQSAATAAVHAIDENVAVQSIDSSRLRERLLADGQVLVWTGPQRRTPIGIDLKKLPGVVVDDLNAVKTGEWLGGRSVGPFVGHGYLHDGNEDKGTKSVRFEAKLPKPGRYDVRLYYSPNPNRATNVPVTVHHADGPESVRVNQRKAFAKDSQS
ncbi:MAG: FAD-dependent oxidoreductase, partial [Planctomycetota bacterium]